MSPWPSLSALLALAPVLFGLLAVAPFSLGFPVKQIEVDDVDLFIQAALTQSEAYGILSELTDTFGHRLTGSQALEQAIDWVVARMTQEAHFDSVETEIVQVPYWIRGHESARMLQPRVANLSMTGLGMSIGTGGKPVVAPALVVKSFDELERLAEQVPGCIVVYNQAYTSYGATVDYRFEGATRAAALGAVAALVRSVTPFSLDTPHTGSSDTATIPAAAITVEDAELLQRFQDRGERIVLELTMEATFYPDVFSRNIVADYLGSEHPEQVIVIGGHMDSWDLGTGALDDAGGITIAWEAVRLMSKLGIRPKRTIRVVMWTNEENGAKGAEQYYLNRQDQVANHVYALESDGGVFTPLGVGFTGTQEAFEILTEIGERYLGFLGAGNVTAGGGGVDIEPLCSRGVPCSSLNDADGVRADKTDSYFYYHHTKADTMSVIRKEELDGCVATIGTFALAIANLEDVLPR